MAKQKNEVPYITHTEILSLAITQAYSRYREYLDKLTPSASDEAKELIKSAAAPWREKLQMLMQLYTIETGTEYGLDIDEEENV